MSFSSMNLVVKEEPFRMTQEELKTTGYAFIPADVIVHDEMAGRGYLVCKEEEKDIFNDIPEASYHTLVHCPSTGYHRYNGEEFVPWQESPDSMNKAWVVMNIANQPRNPKMPMSVWTMLA